MFVSFPPKNLINYIQFSYSISFRDSMRVSERNFISVCAIRSMTEIPYKKAVDVFFTVISFSYLVVVTYANRLI